MDIIDLTTLRSLVFHDHLHGRHFRFRMWTQAPNIQGPPFGVGQYKHACQPLDALQSHCLLPLEFLTPARAPRHDLRVAGLGLRETSLGTRDFLVHFLRGAAYFFIYPLQNLGQRQLHMLADALDFGQAFRARTSSTKGAKAFSLSQAVASGRVATGGRPSGAVVGLRLPRTSGSWRQGEPSLASSIVNSRS